MGKAIGTSALRVIFGSALMARHTYLFSYEVGAKQCYIQGHGIISQIASETGNVCCLET